YPTFLAKAAALDVGNKGSQSEVVESESVDQCLRSRQPEQAWLRVAGLRARRDGANFHETKSQGGQGVDVGAVLVQPRSEPDGIAQGQAHEGAAARHYRGA